LRRRLPLALVVRPSTIPADAACRVEQLRARIVANAQFQEDEEPAEDA